MKKDLGAMADEYREFVAENREQMEIFKSIGKEAIAKGIPLFPCSRSTDDSAE